VGEQDAWAEIVSAFGQLIIVRHDGDRLVVIALDGDRDEADEDGEDD
jgi:hypothetical protein